MCSSVGVAASSTREVFTSQMGPGPRPLKETTMPRPEQINKNALQQLREAFESPRDLAERLALVLAIRESNEQAGDELDRFFLTELERRQLAIAEFRKEREKLRELLAQMTAPPWHLATFR